jgi:hypothetical protein
LLYFANRKRKRTDLKSDKMDENKDFSEYRDVPVLHVSSKESVFLVSLPGDLDLSTLKGVRVNIQTAEKSNTVVTTTTKRSLRVKTEAATDMDQCMRALVRDKATKQIKLGPEFAGVLTFTEAIPNLKPLPVKEVRTIKVSVPNRCPVSLS